MCGAGGCSAFDLKQKSLEYNSIQRGGQTYDPAKIKVLCRIWNLHHANCLQHVRKTRIRRISPDRWLYLSFSANQIQALPCRKKEKALSRTPYRLFQRWLVVLHQWISRMGERVGLLGAVAESAWDICGDSTRRLSWKPFRPLLDWCNASPVCRGAAAVERGQGSKQRRSFTYVRHSTGVTLSMSVTR